MRDLDALLNSLVNIDRHSFIAISHLGGRSCQVSEICSTTHCLVARKTTRGRGVPRPWIYTLTK